MIRTVFLICCAVLGCAAAVGAQPASTPPQQTVSPIPLNFAFDSAAVPIEPQSGQPPGQQPLSMEGRACEGCPRRSVGKSLFHTTIINVFYELANLARGQVTAEITPKTWWANMQQGWVWDLDDFLVNQVGHPYQGNNYFTAGRSNGLSFYESAAVTAFGSGTWEYFGETNHPSLNDFINTTLGGIALGEMFHRVSWMVRDTRATGRGRLWKEIGAMALDPVTGANRFITGDASRVSDKPAEFVPSTVGGFTAAGALWQGSQTRAFDSTGEPFIEMDLLYGDPKTGTSRTPYDAFSVRLRFGGGSAFSEARVKGRLAGMPIVGDKVQFSVIQSYDFQSNDAFSTGSQSFEGAFSRLQKVSERNSLWLVGWGGATVLGAVDSLPLGLSEIPEDEETEDGESPGQGVSEGPRYYDYGPGGNFGVAAEFARDGRTLVIFSYEGRHLYSLDGVRANHLLQRTRVDLLLPLRGPLGFGASGEYLKRHTYYQDADRTELEYHYPQVRVYFTWRLS